MRSDRNSLRCSPAVVLCCEQVLCNLIRWVVEICRSVLPKNGRTQHCLSNFMILRCCALFVQCPPHAELLCYWVYLSGQLRFSESNDICANIEEILQVWFHVKAEIWQNVNTVLFFHFCAVKHSKIGSLEMFGLWQILRPRRFGDYFKLGIDHRSRFEDELWNLLRLRLSFNVVFMVFSDLVHFQQYSSCCVFVSQPTRTEVQSETSLAKRKICTKDNCCQNTTLGNTNLQRESRRVYAFRALTDGVHRKSSSFTRGAWMPLVVSLARYSCSSCPIPWYLAWSWGHASSD